MTEKLAVVLFGSVLSHGKDVMRRSSESLAWRVSYMGEE